MNFKLLIGAAVAIPVAYVGATAFVGKSIESSFADATKQITEKVPYIKVAKRDYKAGMLSSTDETVLTFGDDPNATVTLRSSIQHGPLPGLRSVGSARVTTDIIFPPKAEAELKKLFGEQRPLTIITTRGFGGSVEAQLKSPAAKATIEGSAVDWKGLNSNIAASGDSYTMTLTSDGLVADIPKVGNMTMKAINLDGKATQMAGAEGIWLGKSKMTMGGFDMINKDDTAKTIKFGAITAASDTSTKEAGFVDQIIAMTITDLEVAGEKMGPMTFNYGIKHADAAALGAINKAMTANYSAALKGEKVDDAAQTKMVTDALQKHGMQLLKGQPVFEIEKFSIALPGGESKISAIVKLAPITEAELQGNPMMLISKIDAAGDLQLAEGALKQAMAKQMTAKAKKDGTPEAQTKQMLDMTNQMMDAQTQKFVGLGYATQKDGMITSKFAFKGGQFTLNGKPFDPRALK
jgi:uncharacterized protein YdgA (DUF945 family)